jgi:hypothetical protein
LAWQDWQSVANYDANDRWPREWARFYCENSIEYIFEFLRHKKITFLPLVNWAERGIYGPGNTVPRWHIAWSTGYEIVHRLLNALQAHPHRANLQMLFDTDVRTIEIANGRATGIRGSPAGREIAVDAERVIIASGGICGGDLSKVRAHWYRAWGAPPEKLLNGAHVYGDGMLHDRAAEIGAAVTHLDLQWHYPAGVHHPARRRPDDGLSLVPPRSALWFNARGERIMNPGPMAAYGDTRHLVASVLPASSRMAVFQFITCHEYWPGWHCRRFAPGGAGVAQAFAGSRHRPERAPPRCGGPDRRHIASGIGEALAAAQGQPVIVDVRIDYSKRTRFTKGVVGTVLKRFPLRDRARFIGRALLRKVTG